MRWKFPLAIIGISFFVLYLSSCSKESEDRLTANNPVTCDTTNVSLSMQVLPILQNNCYSCHGKGNTAGSGGIDLSTYSALKTYANSGYLVGNVTHAPGYVGMPYGLPMLPSCEVNTIVAWVHQGAQNN